MAMMAIQCTLETFWTQSHWRFGSNGFSGFHLGWFLGSMFILRGAAFRWHFSCKKSRRNVSGKGFCCFWSFLQQFFRVTHSSHFTIMFFLKQTDSHFANFCLATYAIFPAPNKINFSSIPPHKKTLGKPCTATPCTQATRWRSVWAAKNVHSGDLSDARWIGPWHERPLPASPGGAVQAAFWMNDLIFAPSCSPPQKKMQSVKKQAGCFSQTAASAFARSSAVAVGSRPFRMGLANFFLNSCRAPKTPGKETSLR